MPDFNRQQPIHPADCACPRCDPLLAKGRPITWPEIVVIVLIVAGSFAIAFSV